MNFVEPGRRAIGTSAPLQRSEGGARLSARWISGGTRLHALRQTSPCRIFFPRRNDPAVLEAILVNSSGGLVEGDRISISVEVGCGATVIMRTQAAEKIYRSLTRETVIATELVIGRGGFLDWRPQEAILFDGARLSRSQSFVVEADSRFLSGEVVIFGRIARGETFAHGELRDAVTVRCGGRLLFADRLRLGGEVAALRHARFGLGGSAGLASILYFGPGAARLLPFARARAEQRCGGATLVNGILLARFLHPDETRLRGAAAEFLDELSLEIATTHSRDAA
ncbi:Urease accessory protein UreD [Methylocella silvestris BL2]|uniref:Urease accessory protein UreD n=1 Tax=Methylocella silvestris (strain DSM 15510 / CIP 108128 / LMG 27833 / NCIMB 13906 / BL2) TaxID=395965 RepID=B8EPV2_METSB|nr:urease accessory protein UreD [Methylocella silvestris]ACK50956.1 Urease accessory protein UreD [Methylocella silvestris BL2]